LEASDLVKKMEETFGVSAAAATVVAAAAEALRRLQLRGREDGIHRRSHDVAATRSTSLKPFAKSRASA